MRVRGNVLKIAGTLMKGNTRAVRNFVLLTLKPLTPERSIHQQCNQQYAIGKQESDPDRRTADRSHVEEVGFSKRFGLSMFFKKMLELCVCYWYFVGTLEFSKNRYFEGKWTISDMNIQKHVGPSPIPGSDRSSKKSSTYYRRLFDHLKLTT